MAPPFEIRLLGSEVLGAEPERDPMLGGAVRVALNGVVVADDHEFGLERSALALLRTIDQDHDARSDRRAFHLPGLGSEGTYSGPTTRAGFPTLLIHDCGFPAVACSNFYVDWSVRHANGHVQISDVHRYDAMRPTEIRFEEAECVMPRAAYRDEVVRFATSVRDAFFAGGDKLIDDPDQRAVYEAFWAEYDTLLAEHRARG